MEEEKEKVKTSTRNFAKRQMTYFRKNKDIKWFVLEEERQEIFEEVEKFIFKRKSD